MDKLSLQKELGVSDEKVDEIIFLIEKLFIQDNASFKLIYNEIMAKNFTEKEKQMAFFIWGALMGVKSTFFLINPFDMGGGDDKSKGGGLI